MVVISAPSTLILIVVLRLSSDALPSHLWNIDVDWFATLKSHSSNHCLAVVASVGGRVDSDHRVASCDHGNRLGGIATKQGVFDALVDGDFVDGHARRAG